MLKKIALVIMLILPMGAIAQTLKFGHINSQEIIVAMPEFTAAQTELQTLQKKYVDEIDRLNKEFQTKYQAFQNEMSGDNPLPENIAERRQKELQEMMQRAEQFQQEADQSMQKKQNELMMPIYQKLDEAIKAVGQAQGMIYIFDVARGGVSYVSETLSVDAGPLVKTRLGIN